jgi:hypothetical protein
MPSASTVGCVCQLIVQNGDPALYIAVHVGVGDLIVKYSQLLGPVTTELSMSGWKAENSNVNIEGFVWIGGSAPKVGGCNALGDQGLPLIECAV